MLSIKQATIHDADTLSKLSESIHQVHVDMAPEFYCTPTRAEAATEFRRLLEEADITIFIAWLDNEPVGYSMLKTVVKSQTVWSHASRKVYVDHFSVEPSHQRQGIGRQLMQTSLEFAKQQQATELYLEFWSQNQQAREFYQALNFQPTTEEVRLIILGD